MNCSNAVAIVASVSRPSVALAMPKSMTLGAATVDRGDENVRRLEVAMDDALLVCVLDGVADAREQLEPRRHRQPAPVAEFRDPHAIGELHHEERPAGVGRPG